MLGEVGDKNSDEDETVVDREGVSMVTKELAEMVTHSDKMKLKLTP